MDKKTFIIVGTLFILGAFFVGFYVGCNPHSEMLRVELIPTAY